MNFDFYSFNLSKNIPDESEFVELIGIEPITSALQGRRSPSWAIAPKTITSFMGFGYIS